MSNSIAPGSSADVNVKVTALTTNPNVPVTYKTIILKKNLVNGVNTLTQEMMSAQNTKYVIKYDYVLGGNITVPVGCILEFDGGSISGAYTITGANTGINAGLVKILNTDVTLAGTWNVAEAYPEWFGAVGDDYSIDCTPIIKKMFALKAPIIFQEGYFYLSELYIEENNISIYGKSDDINKRTIFLPFTNNQRYIIKIGGGEDNFGKNQNIVRKTIVKGISFSNFDENRSLAIPLTKGEIEEGGSEFDFGLFCIDRCEIGNFAITFNTVVNCPCLFIGYSYEMSFDWISAYGVYNKSTCPVIAIGNKTVDISCTKIDKLSIETITCCAIKYLSEKAKSTELVIDDFFFEGTIWNDTIAAYDVVVDYYNVNRDSAGKTQEYEEVAKIPVFDFNGLSNIYINNAYINNISQGKWKNSFDNDGLDKALCFAKVEETAKQGIVAINNLVLNHVPFLYIEDGFKHYGETHNVFKFVINRIDGSGGIISDNNLCNYNTYIKHNIVSPYEGSILELKSFDYCTMLPYIKIGNELEINSIKNEWLQGTSIKDPNGAYKTSLFSAKNIKSTTFDYLSDSNKKEFGDNSLFHGEKSATGNDADELRLLSSNILSDRAYVFSMLLYCGRNDIQKGFQIRYFDESGVEDSSKRININLYGQRTDLIKANVFVPMYVGYSFNLFQKHNSYNESTHYFVSIAISYIKFITPKNGDKFIFNDQTYEYYNGSVNLIQGTFANKPSATDIYIGFKYFCTDKQTTEGATDGIEIIHKGNNVWVDALGRVVS